MGRLSRRVTRHLRAVLLLVFAPVMAGAQQPHQHGTLELNLALQERTLFVEVIAGLEDIAGFEHWPPRSDVEQRGFDQGMAAISDPRSMFSLPERAKCKVKDIVKEEPEQSGNGSNADDHALTDVAVEAHFNVTISYRFKCKSPSDLSQIHVHLFRLFPDVQSIQADLITDTQQTFQELTFAEPVLFLPR